jgi:hypothetical protein
MRRASFLLSPLWGTEVAGTSWSGRARLSAPHRGIRGFLGLGSAQAALPGTTGCKREDPLRHQCSEHLAVRHAPDGTMPKPPVSAVYRCARREPLPLRLKEYPRERRPSRAGFWLGNRNRDKSQGMVSLFGTHRRGAPVNSKAVILSTDARARHFPLSWSVDNYRSRA